MMTAAQENTAPSAQTPRAEANKQSHYPASPDFTADAVIDAMHFAQHHLRHAGAWLVRGDLPACVGAIEASRKALGVALDSLAGLMRSA